MTVKGQIKEGAGYLKEEADKFSKCRQIRHGLALQHQA